MKRIFVTLITLLFIGLGPAFAQTPNDSIVVEKNKFYYHGMQIESMRQIKSVLANDELALKEVRKAGVTNGFAYVVSFIGGFALGWEVVDIIRGNFNPYILVGGIGFTAAGIGLSFLANSQVKKGVAIYNANLGKTSYGGSVQLDIGLTPGGAGLTLSF
jgi:hypothetical protein